MPLKFFRLVRLYMESTHEPSSYCQLTTTLSFRTTFFRARPLDGHVSFKREGVGDALDDNSVGVCPYKR